MSHFKHGVSAPKTVIIFAYIYVVIVGIILYLCGFYENSTFFNWGPPIKFFGRDITTTETFYGLHVLIFLHQLINNWVNSVVYAWIINSVQDPKNTDMEYSKSVSLLIINGFNIYSELDLVFIIVGFMSQISFVVTICIANIITSTYINNRYLSSKNRPLSEMENFSMV